ncbi:hypothetical protein [Pseudomonas viridiflava]|uniref:hypothetical protein n=1 Tax=Pseudomonas viridiflava TaxID=33069 RepID=UPI000F01F0F6|nr:hypothetical protein [Pseudomonas viridiflava]
MLKSIKWVEGRVLVVKVDESLCTLAQMRKNGLMEFFNEFRSEDNWSGADLNKSEILFCIFVAEKQLKSIFLRILDDQEIVKNDRPIINRMLSFEWVSDGVYTANLIELSSACSSLGGQVIKHNLSDKKDIEFIMSHEFCGVVGEPKKITDRLRFFYNSGVNWDEQKKFIYPSIDRPLGYPLE